jgi:hypothetical protein
MPRPVRAFPGVSAHFSFLHGRLSQLDHMFQRSLALFSQKAKSKIQYLIQVNAKPAPNWENHI